MWAFIIWTGGHYVFSLVSSWALASLSSPTVKVIAMFSPAEICSDDPTWVHTFLMSSSQWPVLSRGLSAVCPLVQGRRERTQQPLSPPEGQLHRTGVPWRAANDPYDGLGQPLFWLHYPERDKQSFAVSLDNGPKSKSHRPSFFTRVINLPLCWDASPLPAPLTLPPLYSPKDFQLFCRQWFQKAVKDHWSEGYLQIPVSIQRNASYCVALSNSTF